MISQEQIETAPLSKSLEHTIDELLREKFDGQKALITHPDATGEFIRSVVKTYSPAWDVRYIDSKNSFLFRKLR